ncbi:MAG TPA: hypothetical protein VLN45_08665 [Ignavibacteriaceae bacterium]|nr:hypothetical protein [Ignavibacteriaceae bacterium]
MSKIYHIIVISVLLLLFLSCSSTLQMGKIYTSEEANKLFGNVIYSVDINNNTLSELLKKTDKRIMFGLIDRQLIILDNNRNIIFPDKAEFKETDVFTVYSTNVVMELLSGKALNKRTDEEADTVSIEQRREVLSVSTESNTLESGLKCPPNCAEY